MEVGNWQTDDREHLYSLGIALTEQLQVPLLQLKQAGELLHDKPVNKLVSTEACAATIVAASKSALSLLDAYLYASRVQSRQLELVLEPVSLSALFTDIAHFIEPIAKQYHCDVRVQLSGKYEPVIASRQAISHALKSVSYVLIEAAGSSGKRDKVVTLGAYRTKHGLVGGSFSNIEGVSQGAFKRAKQLAGSAAQPFSSALAGSGAGLFIAETLCSAQELELKVLRHQKAIGFGVSFATSNQLAFV